MNRKAMSDINWLEYSSGGVPASKIFEMVLNDLKEIVSSTELSNVKSTQCEICFIGLISYFEAFCKDLFSSAINIAPQLLKNLKDAGLNVTTDLTDIELYGSEVSHKLGFLVAENFDFGTAQKINSLYKTLLTTTPFSKEQIRSFDHMLRDRNLIVHHGGIYTLKYLEQSRIIDRKLTDNAFFFSLELSKDQVLEKISFIEGIARKMSNSCSINLEIYCTDNKIVLDNEQSLAIKYMGWDEEL